MRTMGANDLASNSIIIIIINIHYIWIFCICNMK